MSVSQKRPSDDSLDSGVVKKKAMSENIVYEVACKPKKKSDEIPDITKLNPKLVFDTFSGHLSKNIRVSSGKKFEKKNGKTVSYSFLKVFSNSASHCKNFLALQRVGDSEVIVKIFRQKILTKGVIHGVDTALTNENLQDMIHFESANFKLDHVFRLGSSKSVVVVVTGNIMPNRAFVGW